MRCGWLVLATVVSSCGDNSLPVGVELVHGEHLAIVAHPEDDLVFMQPDLLEHVMVRSGVINLYLADAGNKSKRLGLMAAYSASSGFDDWYCGWIDIRGHAAEHCRLADAQLSLVFLGLPEGDAEGEAAISLSRLWSVELKVAVTLGDRGSVYSRANLIDVIREVIVRTDPATVRTFDVARKHGPDHADHVITGAATVIALAASRVPAELIAYRGENTTGEAPNVIEPLFARSAQYLGRYDACAGSCGQCGGVCEVTGRRATWLRRRYAIAMRRTARGALRFGTQCLAPGRDGLLEVGGCADQWELAADGLLRIGGQCVYNAGGELVTELPPDGPETPCARFFFDDEGHLWLDTPPPEEPGGPLMCMVLVDGIAKALRCGIELAPSWEMSPMPTAVPRPSGLAGTGRAVRLGDIDNDGFADLCEIASDHLQCAHGKGNGAFDPVVVIRLLPVAPESLVLGDVDGDGLTDACGRDGGGITCAPAANGFVPRPWSPAFARSSPDGDRSLAAIDTNDDGAAEICGLLPTGGVGCAGDNQVIAELHSPWPRPGPLWPADLDGDNHADWCSATAAGASCGLALHREVTTDGVPWSFSQSGVVDEAPLDVATGAIADIDGDGRADLCRLDANRIVCARSQGYGFGPEATFATFPEDAAPTALWFGNLDGDAKADACVDDGALIRCVRSR